jgi:NAD(P)-dependent dehydrogenase (short-subunit alcohol dehydrogenase family)
VVEWGRRRARAAAPGVAPVAGSGAASAAAVSLNYFGTVAVLDTLRTDLVARPDPRAVIVSSASSLAAGDRRLIDACLAGEEQAARHAAERLIERGRGARIYRSTKIALNRWLRRTAPTERWAGGGVPLNAVAPGIVDTETARATMLADPAQIKVLQDALPQPLGMPGRLAAVTSALAWLLAPENSFTTGQVLYVDGGAEVTLRGEEPYTRPVSYGPRRMARMIYWSTLGRRRFRR